MRNKRKPIYIVAVVTADIAERIRKSGSYYANHSYTSSRTEGGWEAFIGPDKKVLIKRATDLTVLWNSTRQAKGYTVVAGSLGGEIKIIRSFKAY